jgi:transcriptional regulator with XRE-family HTH domain
MQLIGRRLRFFRVTKGLSRAAAAADTGIPPDAIRRIEESTAASDEDLLLEYIGRLGLSYDLILCGDLDLLDADLAATSERHSAHQPHAGKLA